MNITFLHPNLGIGGAERLVVDAALAMQANGHKVTIVTNRYRDDHCFQETKQFDIKVIDFFPVSFCGRAIAFCAYIRMCIAAVYICISMTQDLIFCDSISACLVVFRFFRLLCFCKAKLLFYCHFPDQLLTERKSALKAFYRYFIDNFEAWSIELADIICVNSLFTAEVVKVTFPRLKNSHLRVLYPIINTEFFDKCPRVQIEEIPNHASFIFVSINRYERKKNIQLAIDAFVELKNQVSEEEYSRCFMVIAGGFDRENEENLLHHRELKQYAAEANISIKQILFLRSPSDYVKTELLKRATAVLYTPSGEHFGIVPLEAMYMESCVIAVNSGGPKESVLDNETGFLVQPSAESFAEKMAALVKGVNLDNRMGIAGRKRVLSRFTPKHFAIILDEIIHSSL